MSVFSAIVRPGDRDHDRRMESNHSPHIRVAAGSSTNNKYTSEPTIKTHEVQHTHTHKLNEEIDP